MRCDQRANNKKWTDDLMRNSLFKTSCTMPYVCVPQVNKETTKQYRPLPAMFWPAFEQYSGLTSHKATCSIRSLETKLHSLWVKWLLADMLVFEILQNDGLLCAHSLSLYLPCLFFCHFLCYTRQHAIYTLFCVCISCLWCASGCW